MSRSTPRHLEISQNTYLDPLREVREGWFGPGAPLVRKRRYLMFSDVARKGQGVMSCCVWTLKRRSLGSLPQGSCRKTCRKQIIEQLQLPAQTLGSHTFSFGCMINGLSLSPNICVIGARHSMTNIFRKHWSQRTRAELGREAPNAAREASESSTARSTCAANEDEW